MKLLSLSTALALLLSGDNAAAFAPLPASVRGGAGSNASSTNTSLEMFPNPLQQAKFNLVRSLAGDYDQAAIQARLNGLINDNPLVMLSFVT
mmetsp:Transcript_29671/g.62006  ORF Transcript_29671/g.62006 Transcript_29671/m.62006 type:complete len:92 (+) Transcript_29671:82-357(+)